MKLSSSKPNQVQDCLQKTYTLKTILIAFCLLSFSFFYLHYAVIGQLRREQEELIERIMEEQRGNKSPKDSSALSFPVEQCKARKMYVGDRSYGGWMICPLNLNSKSIVYSFGIGENAEFDQKMIQRFNLEKLYAFDPTPKSIEFVRKQQEQGQLDKDRFQLFPIALISDSKQTEMKMYLPKNRNHVSGSVVKSSQTRHLNEEDYVIVQTMDLPRIMKKLNHDHIDLLKLDIEGAEFEVFKSLLADGSFNYCNQVLVEQHSRFYGDEEGNRKLAEMNQLFTGNGFKLIHVEKGEEYTFVREMV